LIGYLFVESATSGFFTGGHADRLGAVADQAGSAISNARLAGRASALAAAEERQRLARDLHDAVNQALWTASLNAESLLRDVPVESDYRPRIERLRTLTRGALSEMRSLLLELRPAELAQVGLNELIEQLLAALESRRTLAITTDLADVDLEPAAHLALYRIAQEALQNVAQHAEAEALWVELRRSGEHTELEIRDDGKGFDVHRVPAGHLGLTIMRERAEAIGATFMVDSVPGLGTTLAVRVR
jgi:two-component system nitrate/nitrite sensor histidine kinase NarX